MEPSQRKLHAPIEPPAHPTYDLRKVIQDALREDAGDRGDVTTQATVACGTAACATFLAKSPGVLAGLAVADLVFEMVDPTIQVVWGGRDGEEVEAGHRFGSVTGPAASILVAERVALNFMQRMSGIATATRAMVLAVEGVGRPGGARILETRKTAPGLRLLDKWAVLIGGGHNHRMGLYDMMMIKDNHVTAAGGITAAITRAEEFIAAQGLADMSIEVETRTQDEVGEVLHLLAAGKAPHVTRLMLDNMTRLDPGLPAGIDVSELEQAVKRVAGAVDTEASGNVVQETVRAIAATGVTFISVGSLTHSVKALDISLKIQLVL
ncbi:Quinolinate phosphoribosyl transferase [Haematococcus lacustris]